MSPALCGSPETNKNSKGVMFNHLNGRIQQQILSDIYNWLFNFFSSSFFFSTYLSSASTELRFLILYDDDCFNYIPVLGSGLIVVRANLLSLRILCNYCEHIFTFLLMDKKPTVVVKKVFFAPISGFST